MLSTKKLKRLNDINDLIKYMASFKPHHFASNEDVAEFIPLKTTVNLLTESMHYYDLYKRFTYSANNYWDYSHYPKAIWEFVVEAKQFIMDNDKEKKYKRHYEALLRDDFGYSKEDMIKIREKARDIGFLNKQVDISLLNTHIGDIFYYPEEGFNYCGDPYRLNSDLLSKITVTEESYWIESHLLHYPYESERKYNLSNRSLSSSLNEFKTEENIDLTNTIHLMQDKYSSSIDLGDFAKDIMSCTDPIVFEYLLKILFWDILTEDEVGVANLNELYSNLLDIYNSRCEDEVIEESWYRIIPDSMAWGYLLLNGIDLILKKNKVNYVQRKRLKPLSEDSPKVILDIKHRVLYQVSLVLSKAKRRDVKLEKQLDNKEIFSIMDKCTNYIDFYKIEKNRKYKFKKGTLAKKLTMLNITTSKLEYNMYSGPFNIILACKMDDNHDITKNLLHELGHYLHYSITGNFNARPSEYGVKSKVIKKLNVVDQGELFADQFAYRLLLFLRINPFNEVSYKGLENDNKALLEYSNDCLFFNEYLIDLF